MRNTYRVAAASLAALVMLGSVHASAQAGTAATGVAGPVEGQRYFVQNLYSELALEVEGGSTANSARIVQNPAVNGTQRQAWTFTRTSDGYFVFRSATTEPQKAISITGGSTANGAKAIQYTYIVGSTNEQWIAIDHGANTFQFKNRQSGKCLEIAGPNIHTRGFQADQWECLDHHDNELWVVIPWS